MAVDPDLFRRVLGTWVSGVTIVTAGDGDRVLGMTVSAFSSVSLKPALVLVCADRASNTLELIEASACFGVSVLAENQQDLSDLFADKRREAVRFEGLECADGATGCPRIPGAVSYLDCRVVDTIGAGDHVLYIGSVEAAEVSDRPPLLYARGTYQALR